MSKTLTPKKEITESLPQGGMPKYQMGDLVSYTCPQYHFKDEKAVVLGEVGDAGPNETPVYKIFVGRVVETRRGQLKPLDTAFTRRCHVREAEIRGYVVGGSGAALREMMEPGSLTEAEWRYIEPRIKDLADYKRIKSHIENNVLEKK